MQKRIQDLLDEGLNLRSGVQFDHFSHFPGILYENEIIGPLSTGDF